MEWFVDTGSTLCIWKNITGHDCLGCGTMRAMLSVFHGQWSQAYLYNRLIVLSFPVLLYLWLRWVVSLIKEISQR
ncbi:MAG: DUF2752 domain-containing protein [Mucinivorans sp.]